MKEIISLQPIICNKEIISLNQRKIFLIPITNTAFWEIFFTSWKRVLKFSRGRGARWLHEFCFGVVINLIVVKIS